MVGSEVCADEQVMCGNWDDLIWEGKNVAGGPATPEENGEHNKHNHDEDSSSPSPPIIIPIPIPIAIPWGNENENENATSSSSSSLETTKETLFDSFAPASDKLLLAPHHRKYREESRNHVVRRLDFFTKDDLSNVEVMVDEEEQEQEQEQERLFEIVYGTIMDAIMAEAGNGNGNGNSSGSPPIPGTPKTAPLLNGIAHTCPPPPIKSSASNNHNMRVFIDKEICKKLHF